MFENNYKLLLNNSIINLFKDAMGISIKNPLYLWFFIKTIFHQRRASKLRDYWNNTGISVPPFIIASITQRCNLKCKGCYANALRSSSAQEMDSQKLEDVLKEAKELGISIILVAGGEPFIKKDILNITSMFPEIIFPIFTNGMLLDEKAIKTIKKQKNVVPIISIEGKRSHTDLRRGEGTYEILRKLMLELKSNGVFYGTSITVTEDNFSNITEDEYIERLVEDGCKLFFYVEYVPVTQGTDNWVISQEKRIILKQKLDKFREKYSALFISFPGDEEAFGGCLSSGRGFIHISPEGNVEPCPFAPFSDTSLKDMSLKEALKSDLLKTIRQNHSMLEETSGGCALWEKQEWVKSLLK